MNAHQLNRPPAARGVVVRNMNWKQMFDGLFQEVQTIDRAKDALAEQLETLRKALGAAEGDDLIQVATKLREGAQNASCAATEGSSDASSEFKMELSDLRHIYDLAKQAANSDISRSLVSLQFRTSVRLLNMFHWRNKSQAQAIEIEALKAAQRWQPVEDSVINSTEDAATLTISNLGETLEACFPPEFDCLQIVYVDLPPEIRLCRLTPPDSVKGGTDAS